MCESFTVLPNGVNICQHRPQGKVLDCRDGQDASLCSRFVGIPGLHRCRYCSTDSEKEGEAEVADLEDLGGPVERSGRKANPSATSAADGGEDARKQMLSPPLRAALGKQGYKLIGVARQRTNRPPSCVLDCCYFGLRHDLHTADVKG